MDVFEKHQTELESIAVGIALGDLVDINLGNALDYFNDHDPVYVIGAGKGVVELGRKAEQKLGSQIADGIVIAPEADYSLNAIQVFEGFHPLPNRDSVAGTWEILDLLDTLPPHAQVLALFTGGASALMCMPGEGLEISDLQDTYHRLLNSGASIHEINVVRKQLSQVKGGRLARRLREHRLVTLMLSDVPGDDPATIGSGPTMPDNCTYEDAAAVLEAYDLWDKVPYRVRNYIQKGIQGDVEEVLSIEEFESYSHYFRVISGRQCLLQNVADYLSHQSYNVYTSKDHFSGPVSEVSKMICSAAITTLSQDEPVEKPAALIFNGESEIKVVGNGKGGRNQHLALIAALSLEGQHATSVLCMGTDGSDGSTDASGAIINSHTTLKARKKKLDPEAYLSSFDSYHFHQDMNTLIRTGKTGTNLMDLVVVLVEKNIRKS